jgi:hypothetical protein
VVQDAEAVAVTVGGEAELRAGSAHGVAEPGQVLGGAVGCVASEVRVAGVVDDGDRQFVLEQDVVEVLAGSAVQRVHNHRDLARPDRLPVDQPLEALEVAGLRVVRADQPGARQPDVIPRVGKRAVVLLDAVGVLLGRQNAVAGVDLEAVVLGWVVAAGEGDAGVGLALEHGRRHRRRRDIAGTTSPP